MQKVVAGEPESTILKQAASGAPRNEGELDLHGVGLARQNQKQSGSWKQLKTLHIQAAALRPNMRNFAVGSAAPLLLCQLWFVGAKSCHIQVNAPPFLPGGFFGSLHYRIPPPSSQRLQQRRRIHSETRRLWDRSPSTILKQETSLLA